MFNKSFLTAEFFDCIPKYKVIHDISDERKIEFIFNKIRRDILWAKETYPVTGIYEDDVIECLNDAFREYESTADKTVPVEVVLPAFVKAKEYTKEVFSGREKAIAVIKKLKCQYFYDEETFESLQLAIKLLERI